MKHVRINKLLGRSMPHRHELEGGHTPQGGSTPQTHELEGGHMPQGDLRPKRMN
jgi:hypothetical protein